MNNTEYKMKIAFVRVKYVPYGGAENYLTLIGKELLRQGHEIHVFSNLWKGNDNSFIFHKVPVIKGSSFLRALSFAIFTNILIKRERFDIIISFDRILYQDIYRAGDGCHREWLEKRRIIDSPPKTILTKISPFHKTVLYLERRIYQGNGCRRIVANSFKGRDDIVRYYQTPEEKITVIYNGVNLNRFKPSNRDVYREDVRRRYGMSDSDTVILFVGSGFERKGLRFLLEGVGLLKSSTNFQAQSPKILVVGKGNYTYYKRLAERLGIEQDVIFAGITEIIEKFYSASDIFILPSIYDPFSNACLEAMASGLPVITTRNNGASEIIEDGKDGFVLEDPANTTEMASRIEQLMDENLRDTFGRRAREKAEKFTVEGAVRKMVEICG